MGTRGRTGGGGGGDDGDDPIVGWRAPDDAVWRSERLVVELAGWRLTLELALAGAILNRPRVGMLRAGECGVTADLFERGDAWCMYQAAAYCASRGEAEDKAAVLAMACRVLQWRGYWDAGAPRHERRMAWSAHNLTDLACGADGPAEVVLYAGQLVDLDRRQRIAGRCWRRMYEVLEGWGKEGIGRMKAEG